MPLLQLSEIYTSDSQCFHDRLCSCPNTRFPRINGPLARILLPPFTFADCRFSFAQISSPDHTLTLSRHYGGAIDYRVNREHVIRSVLFLSCLLLKNLQNCARVHSVSDVLSGFSVVLSLKLYSRYRATVKVHRGATISDGWSSCYSVVTSPFYTQV